MNSKTILLLLLLLSSLVILSDFIFTGKEINERVVSIDSSMQSHNNAGGGFYYSHSVATSSFSFPVSGSFSSKIKVNDSITLKVSPIFNEINSYDAGGIKETYSLRIFSTVVIPIFAIIVAIISFFHGNKTSIILFISGCLVLINLVFLIF